MMSILSGMVLMVAIGTVVQKSDSLEAWLSTAPAAQLVADDVQVRPGEPAMLDVLANDLDVEEDAGERLVITAEPICGRASVLDGMIQYFADESCLGGHGFAYGLRGSAAAPAQINLAVVSTPPRRETGPDVPGAPGELAFAEPRPDAAFPAPARERAGAAPSAGAAVTAFSPAALPPPAATGAPGPGSAPPRVAARAAVPGLPAPASATPEAPVVGGLASVVRSAGVAPGGSAAPASVSPAASVGSVGRLPAKVMARTDPDGINAPETPAASRAHGIEAAAPRPVARRDPDPAGNGAAPEIARADPDTGPPRAPKPGAATAPESGLPEVADEMKLAAAPATAARPGRREPARPTAPGDVRGTITVPGRRDSDPLSGNAAEPARGDLPPRLTATEPGQEPELTGRERGLQDGRPTPENPPALAGLATPGFGLAQSAVPRASAEPEAGTAPAVDLSSGPGEVARAEPPLIATAADERVALAEPASGLGPVRALGNALRLAPVDTAEPLRPKGPTLAPAGALPAREATAVAALGAAEPGAADGAPSAKPAGTGEKVAALPPADAACVVPPGLSLDIGRAAITEVHVASPCHAGTAAVLDYGAMSLGVALGPDGKGSIEVPGFESSMEATLGFADGTSLDFTLPFQEIERVERVAVVWDLPVTLDLHAREFGAAAGAPGHVRPDNRRSLDEVRRSGGGFLHGFAPVDGAGSHARVYTYYLRRGGPTGVVDMTIDFASRRAAEPGTCGDGALASPGFTVVRTARGIPEQSTRARLAALDCGNAAEGGGEMITNAVGDLVITY